MPPSALRQDSAWGYRGPRLQRLPDFSRCQPKSCQHHVAAPHGPQAHQLLTPSAPRWAWQDRSYAHARRNQVAVSSYQLLGVVSALRTASCRLEQHPRLVSPQQQQHATPAVPSLRMPAQDEHSDVISSASVCCVCASVSGPLRNPEASTCQALVWTAHTTCFVCLVHCSGQLLQLAKTTAQGVCPAGEGGVTKLIPTQAWYTLPSNTLRLCAAPHIPPVNASPLNPNP
jgi:hypothetical protein